MKITMIMALVLLSACGRPHDGVNGSNGHDGAVGATGADGIGCTETPVPANGNAPNGGTLITCSNGSNLILNGTNGLNGTDGTDGTNGTNGSDGAAGTSFAFSSIQFCAGTPSYSAGNFPEIGFCINNVLYGVYSANGGYLTVIQQGTWSSDPVGTAQCTFTVGPDCKVTR